MEDAWITFVGGPLDGDRRRFSETAKAVTVAGLHATHHYRREGCQFVHDRVEASVARGASSVTYHADETELPPGFLDGQP